jgi:hypothetical protein
MVKYKIYITFHIEFHIVATLAVKSTAMTAKSDYNLPNLTEIRFDMLIYTKDVKESPSSHYGLPKTGKRANALIMRVKGGGGG